MSNVPVGVGHPIDGASVSRIAQAELSRVAVVWACVFDVDLLEVHSELWISPGSLQYAGEISAGTSRCGADLESGPPQIDCGSCGGPRRSVEDLDGAFLCTLILSGSILHL